MKDTFISPLLEGIERQTDNLDLYKTDVVYEAEHAPVLVLRPKTTKEVQRIIRFAVAEGVAVSLRGAGLSYSQGYLATDARTLMLDLSRFDRIVNLDVENRHVTVEAGVTWAQLHDALQSHGLTTPFWGTFSGRHATIGATVSQGGKFYGSASRGSSAESVLALQVVTGRGEILHTGSRASTVLDDPFFRNYGPDLTGLFLGDCGAFGVKTEVTLMLVPAAKSLSYSTFSFEDPEQQMRAMAQIGADLLASECQGMDPFTAKARLQGTGLVGDVKTLASVIKGSGGVMAALKNAATIAFNGRKFVKDVGYLMNTVCEGRFGGEAEARQAQVRQIARQFGGIEIASSIPRALRAMPFPPVGSLLTPSGKRMFWLHVMVPNAKGAECFRVTEAIYQKHADQMKAAGIDRGYLLSTHGPTAVGVETILRWSDAPYPIHFDYASDKVRAQQKTRGAHPQARAVLEDIAADIQAAWRSLGGTHVQIGRKYPYFETRQPQTADLLTVLKSYFDPKGILSRGNIF